MTRTWKGPGGGSALSPQGTATREPLADLGRRGEWSGPAVDRAHRSAMIASSYEEPACRNGEDLQKTAGFSPSSATCSSNASKGLQAWGQARWSSRRARIQERDSGGVVLRTLKGAPCIRAAPSSRAARRAFAETLGGGQCSFTSQACGEGRGTEREHNRETRVSSASSPAVNQPPHLRKRIAHVPIGFDVGIFLAIGLFTVPVAPPQNTDTYNVESSGDRTTSPT